jgi:hypothetical protein
MITPYARFLEMKARRRPQPARAGTVPPPAGTVAGPRFTIYQHPITRKFALIKLPDDFADGDPMPLRPTDRWFDTDDGPLAALPEMIEEQE